MNALKHYNINLKASLKVISINLTQLEEFIIITKEIN